jgi:hypothetical protein
MKNQARKYIFSIVFDEKKTNQDKTKELSEFCMKFVNMRKNMWMDSQNMIWLEHMLKDDEELYHLWMIVKAAQFHNDWFKATDTVWNWHYIMEHPMKFFDKLSDYIAEIIIEQEKIVTFWKYIF